MTDRPEARRVSAVRRRLERALHGALAQLPEGPAAEPAREVLRHGLLTLGSPMRVALTGLVSSGKSTLANALAGAEAMPTGTQAVTAAVSVLHHAEGLAEAEALVHYRDGRPAQRRAFAELRELTVREFRETFPDGLSWVEVRGPFPRLGWFDLVDTPGFGSRYDEDARNALAAVGLSQEEAAALTGTQIAAADAVIAVLKDDVHAADAELLTRYRGQELGLTPVNCIGVLTKVELHWPGPPGRPVTDPMVEGRRNADRIMANPSMARLLHAAVPVCSLVAAGAAAFRAEEFEDLRALQAVAPALLERRLLDHRAFAVGDYPDLPVPAARRAVLAGRFGPYGVALACNLLREGIGSARELRAELRRRSGVDELLAMLGGHFGGRRDVLKLGRIALAADQAAVRPLTGDPRERAAVQDALRGVGELTRDEHAFAELDLLRRWYDGRLGLPESEGEELRTVSGEFGRSVAARLGLPAAAPLDELELAAQARLGYWRSSPTAGLPQGRQVVRVMQRRYEQLCHRIGSARELLEDAE